MMIMGHRITCSFPPELWRELFKPQLKKAVDKAHELGMIFELHSCGFMEQIVPDFAEIGVDAWQGQEINDIPKLKAITRRPAGLPHNAENTRILTR